MMRKRTTAPNFSRKRVSYPTNTIRMAKMDHCYSSRLYFIPLWEKCGSTEVSVEIWLYSIAVTSYELQAGFLYRRCLRNNNFTKYFLTTAYPGLHRDRVWNPNEMKSTIRPYKWKELEINSWNQASRYSNNAIKKAGKPSRTAFTLALILMLIKKWSAGFKIVSLSSHIIAYRIWYAAR